MGLVGHPLLLWSVGAERELGGCTIEEESGVGWVFGGKCWGWEMTT